MTDSPALTFDRSAREFVIEAMGWEVTNTGYLYSDDVHDVLSSILGQPVHIDEFAGIVEYEGEARPLRDDFNELVENVKYRHEEVLDD